MLIDLKNNKLFIERASNLTSEIFYNEFKLAQILFNTSFICISIHEQNNYYKTYSLSDFKDENASELLNHIDAQKPFQYISDRNILRNIQASLNSDKPFKCLASVPLYITEHHTIGSIFIISHKSLSSAKMNALMLISNSVSKIIASVLDNKENDIIYNLGIRKAIHDLNNPLASISLQAELINKLTLNDDKTNMIANKIIGNVKRMNEQMNNILDNHKI